MSFRRNPLQHLFFLGGWGVNGHLPLSFQTFTGQIARLSVGRRWCDFPLGKGKWTWPFKLEYCCFWAKKGSGLLTKAGDLHLSFWLSTYLPLSTWVLEIQAAPIPVTPHCELDDSDSPRQDPLVKVCFKSQVFFGGLWRSVRVQSKKMVHGSFMVNLRRHTHPRPTASYEEQTCVAKCVPLRMSGKISWCPTCMFSSPSGNPIIILQPTRLYIDMHTNMFFCIYVRCAYTYAIICIYTCVYIYITRITRVYIYTCSMLHMYIIVCIYIYACVCVCAVAT